MKAIVITKWIQYLIITLLLVAIYNNNVPRLYHFFCSIGLQVLGKHCFIITCTGETQPSYNSLKVTTGIKLELIKLKSSHSTETKAL